ncbi:MAG: LacI family DNA-binding transcriptional regulator [Armatimonadota bacterium]
MQRFRKATISDVAEKAGVSITTVSRFVSGRENVCSTETAKRIRTAISDLHYTPSSMVSSTVGRATRTLGVCMYSHLDVNVSYGGFFFEGLWRGVLAEASETNYALLHYPGAVHGSTSTDPFLDGRVDGLLYHPPGSLRSPDAPPDNRPARLAAAGMPTVVLTRSLNLPDACGAAYADESGTVDLALSHLWERGHRRIAHVAGPTGLGSDIAIGRLNAYRAWMRERGVYDPALEGQMPGWRADGHVAEIVAAWHSSALRPTAVFAANDALALAVIAAARDLGWDVPGELSVVGVDNTQGAAAVGLTSVEPPMEEVGRAAVRALLSLVQGAPVAPTRIAVPVTRIVFRDSVGSS